MKFRLAEFCAISALAGCAGMNTAMEYNTTVHHVQMADDNYRVFEHPKGDRIMVTPSTGATAKLAVSHQVLVPGPVLETPVDRMQAAARKYLDETNRANCQITNRKLVMEPQYEFYFTCG
jgi:hypothetical protein